MHVIGDFVGSSRSERLIDSQKGTEINYIVAHFATIIAHFALIIVPGTPKACIHRAALMQQSSARMLASTSAELMHADTRVLNLCTRRLSFIKRPLHPEASFPCPLSTVRVSRI